jgi:hypothetical protein
MWSAVCSRSSMGDRRPGAKMTPGGGVPSSGVSIPARSASGERSSPEGVTAAEGNRLLPIWEGGDHPALAFSPPMARFMGFACTAHVTGIAEGRI